MEKEIEKKLNKLEEYVVDEMDAIRKLTKKLTEKKDIKELVLFSITSYEGVCKVLKEECKISPYDKIKQIEKLFNGWWKKDWEDINQKKWYPYFNLKASHGVVGFYDSYFSCGVASGQVGFYKDQRTSDYIGKTFWLIYKEIIM